MAVTRYHMFRKAMSRPQSEGTNIIDGSGKTILAYHTRESASMKPPQQSGREGLVVHHNGMRSLSRQSRSL